MGGSCSEEEDEPDWELSSSDEWLPVALADDWVLVSSSDEWLLVSESSPDDWLLVSESSPDDWRLWSVGSSPEWGRESPPEEFSMEPGCKCRSSDFVASSDGKEAVA